MDPAEDVRDSSRLPTPLFPPHRLKQESLPAPLTSLIGRERDLELVLALLQNPDNRLVTIVGAPGIGKTRLALATAAHLHLERDRDLIFIPLATVGHPNRMAAAIAQGCGIAEVAGVDPVRQLGSVVADQSLILVLDNLEHLLAASPELLSLLAICPNLQLLATSRIRLGVSGERLHELGSLELPTDEPVSRERLPASMMLFSERAQAVDACITWTPDELRAVSALCRALDGEPLAIELAAARTRHFSPSDLAFRVTQLLPLLEGGAREQTDRLRSMRGALGWSYALLSPGAQSALRWLSVFGGSFSLEDAGALLGSAQRSLADAPEPFRTAEVLGELLDHHLVGRLQDATGSTRFVLHQVVREFAEEQLSDRQELTFARTAHAHHFGELAQQMDLVPHGSLREAIRLRLHDQFHDVRAAFEWLIASGQYGSALEFALSSRDLSWNVGHTAEVRAWIELAVELADPKDPSVRGETSSWAGLLAAVQGDDLGAASHFEEAMRAVVQIEDPQVRGRIIRFCGQIAGYLDDLPTALSAHLESVRLARTGSNLNRLAAALCELGSVQARAGLRVDAEATFAEAFERSVALNYRPGETLVRLCWATTAVQDGRLDEALAQLDPALALAVDQRDISLTSEAIFRIADFIAASGRPELAVRLAGSAEALRDSIARKRFRRQLLFDMLKERLRTELGSRRYESNFSAGLQMSNDAAIDQAQKALTSAHESPVSAARPYGLTRRELEVLRLLASGKSDREIADTLFVSRVTASHHVESIRRKLDVESRTAAVAKAVQAQIIPIG